MVSANNKPFPPFKALQPLLSSAALERGKTIRDSVFTSKKCSFIAVENRKDARVFYTRGTDQTNRRFGIVIRVRAHLNWMGLRIGYTELCKNTLLSFVNHSQNVPLPTPNLHYGPISQPFPKPDRIFLHYSAAALFHPLPFAGHTEASPGLSSSSSRCCPPPLLPRRPLSPGPTRR